MARMGRFGRRRRQSSNLAGLIASLIREQRAAEDRAMFDAWRNGGLVDGKAVTDQRLLAFIKGRRDGFSKDDPLYDQWNNTLIQHEFVIGEQKIGLAFKQGKVSAGAVASWYRGQLSKIPKDSAFYREVAGRASDWAKSAASAARGRARSSAVKAVQAKIDRLSETVADYVALEQFLTQAAQQAGIVLGTQTLVDADATQLMALLSSGLQFNGRPVSLAMWRDASMGAYRAMGQQVDLLRANGGAWKDLNNRRQKLFDQGIVRINAVDDRAKYEMAREEWEAEVARANGDPFAVLEASKKYAARLTGIRDTAITAGNNDPQIIGALANEINAVLTGKASGATITDLFAGAGEGTGTGDADTSAASAMQAAIDVQRIMGGTAYYGQTDPGGNFGVHDYPLQGGLDPTGRNGLPQGQQIALLDLNGTPRPVVLAGAAVYARAMDDDGGVSEASKNPIGYVFTDPLSGLNRYGVVTPDGSMVFTLQNPFTTGLQADGKGGFFVVAGAIGDFVTDERGRPVFQAGAGLTPQALSALQGGSPLFDPLMVDSTVAATDIPAFVGTGDPAVDAYIERRRSGESPEALAAEAQYGAQARGQGRTQAPFVNPFNVRAGQPNPQAQQSSLGGMLGGLLEQVSTVLRVGTLPTADKGVGTIGSVASILQPPPAPKPTATPTAPKPATSVSELADVWDYDADPVPSGSSGGGAIGSGTAQIIEDILKGLEPSKGGTSAKQGNLVL